MKSVLSIFCVLFSCSILHSQQQILYDLDSYRRVNARYQTTNISPEFNANYFNILNTTTNNKSYTFKVGGYFDDDLFVNNENQQNVRNIFTSMDISSGSRDRVSITSRLDKETRTYRGNDYLKTGYNIDSRLNYLESSPTRSNYSIDKDIEIDIGFGFGRLEVINEAWFGGRLLEELQKKELLKFIPSAAEMKFFFDFLGELRFERVMDPRLRDIYRIEEMVGYLESKGWIEEGSIPAFVTIYDAFRYENFLIRQSGNRLEFTMSPKVNSRFRWVKSNDNSFDQIIRPGIVGTTEYEIHRNGDLAYYTTIRIGGRMEYLDYIFEEQPLGRRYTGTIYFDYSYRYLPSLRTNLAVTTDMEVGFVEENGFDSKLQWYTYFSYDYYFSPATRLSARVGVNYFDDKFQMGDFQPQISMTGSVNVVHSIR